AVGFRMVGADPGAGVADAGIVALVERRAGHRAAADARACLAGVVLRAGVAVVARGAVGVSGARAVGEDEPEHGAEAGVAAVPGRAVEIAVRAPHQSADGYAAVSGCVEALQDLEPRAVRVHLEHGAAAATPVYVRRAVQR